MLIMKQEQAIDFARQSDSESMMMRLINSMDFAIWNMGQMKYDMMMEPRSDSVVNADITQTDKALYQLENAIHRYREYLNALDPLRYSD